MSYDLARPNTAPQLLRCVAGVATCCRLGAGVVQVPEVGAVSVRHALFVLTSSVGGVELARAGIGARDFGRQSTEAAVEVVKQATRSWCANRPALGGRLSNSQVPFV